MICLLIQYWQNWRLIILYIIVQAFQQRSPIIDYIDFISLEPLSLRWKVLLSHSRYEILIRNVSWTNKIRRRVISIRCWIGSMEITRTCIPEIQVLLWGIICHGWHLLCWSPYHYMIIIRSDHWSFQHIHYMFDRLLSDLLRTEIFNSSIYLSDVLNPHRIDQSRLNLHCLCLYCPSISPLIP